MKTPMQEVYENFNLMSDADFKSWMLNTDLLKKEEEMMCEFTLSYFIDNTEGETIEDFFDETFKTKER